MQPTTNSARVAFEQGKQARQTDNFTAAIDFFSEAIRLKPDFIPAYNNLANILQAQGQFEAAIGLYEQALQIAPQMAILHCNLASIRQQQGELSQAITGFQQAISLKPDLVIAQHNLAKALAANDQFTAANTAYQAALALAPQSAEIHGDRGHLYRKAGFIQQAISCYKIAVRLQPKLAQLHNDLGAALQLIGELPLAKSCYIQALEIEPDNFSAHFNLAQVLEHEIQYEAAQAHYEQALALQPDATQVLYHLNFLRLKLAVWQDYEQRVADLMSCTETHLAKEQGVELSPMMLSAFPVPLPLLKKVAQQRAQLQAQSVQSVQALLPKTYAISKSKSIRIGYVSPDFRQHAVGGLIETLFQYHRRPDFEIFAYSLVPPQDACSERIRQGCDHFVDLWQQSPLAIAQRIRADGITILIDLAGHTAYSCTALFALRPAPIQIQYLGYPGTMGADYLPYILADAQLIPPELAEYYSETVLYLPHAWVAAPKPIASQLPQRRECGLPEQGTVFCCFNGVYKIDPQVFAVWMRILQQVPGSVLWLYDGNSQQARKNLSEQAKRFGIAAERLIFVGFLAHEQYLENYRLADLFLDTFIYNAGATAVDALSAGLPVLTCPQQNYAARMGASLVHAVGMPELQCASVADYEKRAIELGNNPELIQSLKAKLTANLPTAALFQPAAFVKTLEQTLMTLWQKYQESPMTDLPTEAPSIPQFPLTTANPEQTLPKTLGMHASEQLYQWLETEQISLAFTTYQTNRLFLIGRNDSGHLAVNERHFDKPMGLYAKDEQLFMATRYQIWQLENRLAPGELYQGCDRLYVPTQANTTGDLNVHDVVVDAQQRLLFINTDFSCLATMQAGYSFVPLWKPPFISKLAAEDRCHLNGLALHKGEPCYVTACSATDDPVGWRKHRQHGGVVMHIPSNEIIINGLSMPHSPRCYQGKLWLLNSGTGEFGYVDGNRFIPVTFCPGFVRGLAFWKNFALVGLSKLRSTSFGGLVLEQRLLADGHAPQCGLLIIDLQTGNIVHWLHIDGIVEELFDVVVLPGVHQPRAFGMQQDDIQRCINFPGSNGMLITKPGVKKPQRTDEASVENLTPRVATGSNAEQGIHFQRIYHLTPETLRPYESMTQPSLQQHWQIRAPRGELYGVSASVAGEMIGLAVAECWQDGEQIRTELLSSYVLPAFRQQPVEAQLQHYLQQAFVH